jgi:soluble lytic murein transglycosylase-like protein
MRRLSSSSTSAVLAAAAALAFAAPAAAGTGTGGAEAPAAEAPATAIQAGAVVAPTAEEAPLSLAAAAPGSAVAARVPYGVLIALTARRYGMSASLFTALVWQESGFNAKARSKAGARGLTQLMPGTARELGVRRVYDPAQNLDGGARYLRALLVRFASVPLALAAYNAGPNAVAKHGGIPPYRETRKYVASILALEARLRASGVR